MVYARFTNTFDSGTAGAQITPANSASSGTAFSAAFGAGVATYNASAAMQGTLGMLTESASSAAAFKTDFPAAVAGAGVSFEFYAASVPTSDIHIARFVDSANARIISVHVNSAGKLRFSDGSGTTGIWTAPDVIVAGTKYRVEMYAKAGTTTSNGELRAAYYLQGSNTAIASSGTITTVNAGTGTPFTAFYFGRYSASAIQFGFDSIVWETDGTGLPGPYTAPATPLSTPVVTLGTTTNATTVGGTGSQVVTWPAVANAASYEAWIANNTSPAQGDFTLVATGVTSPYTFTNVSAGQHAYGIKAKV